jgi:Na+-translocating ferredoxin:NAD+ oxidoreductase RnfE subunit
MLRNALKHHDPWAVVVIVLTLVLFVIALFIKGFTHDVLLETGVFLVSVKLIMMGRRQGELAEALQERLDRIQSLLQAKAPDTAKLK